MSKKRSVIHLVGCLTFALSIAETRQRVKDWNEFNTLAKQQSTFAIENCCGKISRATEAVSEILAVLNVFFAFELYLNQKQKQKRILYLVRLEIYKQKQCL